MESSTDDIDLDHQDPVAPFLDDDTFYSDFDEEVLDRIGYDYQSPVALLKICAPASLMMILTIVLLLSSNAIFSCVWPNRARPSMNTAVTCFLAPLGLVFALSFGFVFTEVLEKHDEVYDNIAVELSYLDQLLTMTTKFSWPSHRLPLAMFKIVKSELISLATLALQKEISTFKANAPKNLKGECLQIINLLLNSVIP